MNKLSLILGAILLLSANADAQVKKKYKDQKHEQQTVVIKTSVEEDDIEILNAEFDINDFKVGEQIKITTENTVAVGATEHTSNAKAFEKSPEKKRFKVKKKQKRQDFVGSSLTFKKRKRKRAKLAYNSLPKHPGKTDHRKKCPKW